MPSLYASWIIKACLNIFRVSLYSQLLQAGDVDIYSEQGLKANDLKSV